MVRRPGDKTPEPPGGRAAERLRMFELARGQPSGAAPDQAGKKSGKRPKKRGPPSTGASNAKQTRRED
jgi:hypothetical protein